MEAQYNMKVKRVKNYHLPLLAGILFCLAVPGSAFRGIKAIKSPTLIVAGDADGVSIAHMSDFFALLGGGLHDAGWDGSNRPANRLAILPGTIHYNMFMSPALVPAVTPFLEEPMPNIK